MGWLHLPAWTLTLVILFRQGTVFLLAGALYPGALQCLSPLPRPPTKRSSSDNSYAISKGLSQPTFLSIGNLSAQLLARIPLHNSNTKHIDVRHHFIRECVTNGLILKSVSSTNEIADIHTKPKLGTVTSPHCIR